MSVYIKGMEMPEKDGVWTLRIWGNGQVERLEGYHSFLLSGVKAIPVPSHGRLVDADALIRRIYDAAKQQPEIADLYEDEADSMIAWLKTAPTIIPADKDGE